MEFEMVLKKITQEETIDERKWKLHFKHEDGHSLTINMDTEPKGWPLNILYSISLVNHQTILDTS